MSGFYTHRFWKCKKDSQVVSLFGLLGSAHVKVVRRMLMKLTTVLQHKNKVMSHTNLL
jgi:hypothetical protein